MKTRLTPWLLCLTILLFLTHTGNAQKQRLIHFWDFNQTLPAGGGGAKGATAGDTLGNSAHPLIAAYSTEATPGHVLYVRPLGITPIILANAAKSSIKGDDSIGGKDSIIDNGSPGAFYYDYSSYYYPYFKTADTVGAAGNLFIRTRNPVDLTGADSANGFPFKNGAAYFYIYASTVGYKNVNFDYAVSASSASCALYSIFQYSTDGGITWKPLVAGMDTFNTGGRMHPDTMQMINPTTAASKWYPCHIGFALDTLVNNNPNFVIRWHNTGNQLKKNGSGYVAAVQSGNNRFDNFTIIGDTNSSALNVAITGLTNITPCFGDSNGTATASALGGVQPYTWSWSSNALEVLGGNSASLVTDSASGLYAGTYTVTVTDNDFNSATATVTISQPTPVIASISSFSNVLCNGGNSGSITAAVTGGTKPYTYVWSNGTTTTTATSSIITNTLSGLTAGTYTCTVSDKYGCSNTATVQTLTEPTAFSSTTASTQVTCTVGGTASVTVSGGTPGYTYLWTSGATTDTATGLGTGTYTVTVTDANSCTYNTSVTVTTSGAVITPSIGSEVSCSGGNNGSASVSVTGGVSPYTYSWSPSSSTATIISTTTSASSLTSGTYKVTVTDNAGCVTSIDINITQPTLLTDTIENVGPSVLIHYWDFNSSPSGDSLGNSVNPLPANYTSIPSGNPHIVYTKPVGTGEPANNFGVDNGTPGTGLYAYASFTGNDTTGSGKANYFIRARNPVIDSAGVEPKIWQHGKSAQFIWYIPSTGYHNVTLEWALTASSSSGAALNIMSYSTDGGITWKRLTNAMDNFTNPSTSTQTGDTLYVLNAITDVSGWVPVNVDLSADPATNNNPNLEFRIEFGGQTALNLSGNDRYDNVSVSGEEYSHVSCHNGSDGAANGVVSGGTAPYTYSWSDGETTSSVSNLAAGTTTLTVTDANGCTAIATTTVINPPALTDTVIVTNNCNNGDTAKASITVIGGTGPYTYSWSPSGATTQSIGSLSPGAYTGTVTDAHGCTASASVTITNPSQLTSAIGSKNVNCHGDNSGMAWEIAGGGTSPYLYKWKGEPNLDTIGNLSAGTYTIKLVDAQGCAVFDTVKITQPATKLLDSANSTNILCFGNTTGSATSFAYGGTAPYVYSWSNGATTSVINAVSAGTYTVMVSDLNSCADTTMVTITQPASALNATVNGTNVACFGNTNGTVNVTVTGGVGTYTYLWSNGATTSSQSSLSGATYSVTITDANGCTSSSNYTVTQPASALRDSIVASSIVNVLCNGGNTGAATVGVKGGTSPYAYAWSPAGGTIAAAINLSVGSYSVIITDNNGCLDSAKVSLTQPSKLRDSLITASIVEVSCNGGNNGAVTVGVKDGTPGYSYAWSPNVSTSVSATGLSAGTYGIIVTDANGCSGTAQFITITQPAMLRDSTIAASIAEVSCNGGSNGAVSIGVAGGTTPYTYVWTPNISTTSSASGLSAGTYSVSISDNNGCTGTAQSITITQPTAIRDSIVSTQCSPSDSASGSATVGVKGGTSPYTYSWSPSGGTGATGTALAPGTYTVTITDNNTCTVQLTTMVSVCATGINPITVAGNKITIYPNPNNGEFAISGLVKGSTLELYNDIGSLIKTISVNAETMPLDITGMANGVYLVRIISENGITVMQQRILKTK
jgi:hypothetical protein